jgi:hypothetical protein
MDIYNNIHALLSTPYYIFRRLWRNHQGELYRMLNYCYIFHFYYINSQEVGGGRGDWMELAQDRDRWRPLVSTVKNLRVP